MKYEVITCYYFRYCYSARRATQNMSASRSFPTNVLDKRFLHSWYLLVF